MIYYKITYLSALTGERSSYMNIGFESEKIAQNELDCILRHYEKIKDRYTEDVIFNCIQNNIHIPVCIIGSDWKIEPIKLRSIE